MSNELERFARENREEFDSAEIPAALWDKIEQQIQPQKKSPVIKMGWMKMAAAAAVIAAIGLITFKVMNNKTTGGEVVKNSTVTPVKTNDTPVIKEPVIAKQQPANENTSEQQTIAKNDTKPEAEIDNENSADQEMYHFTKLIQIKQKQLLSIKHDSPELYEHFVADYNKLDASYNDLKEEMKTNPNKEVLLEKMIGNLQLQIELLNQQLKVVRQLNKIKKDKADEISKTM